MKPVGPFDPKRVDLQGLDPLPSVDGGDEHVDHSDRFTNTPDPKSSKGGEPNRVANGGLEGGAPLGPWSVSRNIPASAASIRATASAHGVTTEKRCYARSEASSVDENYYLNAMESQVRFSQWLDGLGAGPVDVDDMMSTFESLHRVAALGESGQRRYLNLNDRMMFEMYCPGSLRSDEHMSRATGVRPDAVRYTDLVLGELGLVRQPDGPVAFPGVPQDEHAGRLGKDASAYLYPTGGRERLRPFFVVAAEKLSAILSEREPTPRVVALIGEYYHALVSAKPFEQINNSLLMGNVNKLLTRFGIDPVAHGYIDHLAYRTTSDAFANVFVAYVEGKVKSAPDYDLYLEG